MYRRENFTAYETMPLGLAKYLSYFGPHFNKKCCEFAVSQMYKIDENGKEKAIKPYTKEKVNELLKTHNIDIKYAQLEDTVYVANMCKADYYKESVPDEQHLALYVKNTLDDPDGCDGLVFNRWIADMKWLGIAIDWEEFL